MAHDFDSLVSVSGLSGLFRVAANRHNGLIIEDLQSGQRRFAPARSHQFSLLASIGIYTYEGTEDLRSVFVKMKESGLDRPGSDATDSELREYFRQILPDHDEDRVRLSDIRKMLKWYGFLEDREMLPSPEEAATEPAEEKDSENPEG